MDLDERRIWLARHGETEWAKALRHTSHTDLPLTAHGEAEAVALGDVLRGHTFVLVLVSPMRRATDTARLAGLGEVARIDPDLQEWDYGEFEGLLTSEIRETYPGWTIWRGPWPGGETADEVTERADRILERCTAPEVTGDTLLIAHGHLLRVLAARWLGLPAASGEVFGLGTATVSILGWDRDTRVIELWNAPCAP